MKRRTLGVDLGATWLRAALAEDGRIARRWKLPAVRWTALAGELRRLRLGKLDGLTAGATGIWSAADRRCFARSLRPLARRVRALSDVELAHEAAFAGGPGVLVIAGTGAIAYARDARGRSARAGGLGALLGDEGSGFWIGRQALREPRLRRLFPEKLALKLAHDPKPIRAIAALAPKVIRLASKSVAARGILSQAGTDLAVLALQLHKVLGMKSLVPVCCHGSLFENAHLSRAFEKKLGNAFRRQPAVDSPELWAAKGAFTMS